MRVDLESGASRRLGRYRVDAAIVDLSDHATRRANKVMVVRRFARNVGVAPVGEVYALNKSLGNEQIKKAKDRGTPHLDATSPRINYEIGGGEVTIALGDQSRYRTAWPGESDSRLVDGAQEC
jgi:ATP sulfurylase